MRAGTKGIFIGLFVLLVPALIVVYINYYMRVLHPEKLAKGTTAILTQRDETPDGFVLHYQVDDPNTAPTIKRLSKTDNPTFEIRKTEEDARDWQQLQIGSRFCIVYSEVEIQNKRCKIG